MISDLLKDYLLIIQERSLPLTCVFAKAGDNITRHQFRKLSGLVFFYQDKKYKQQTK